MDKASEQVEAQKDGTNEKAVDNVKAAKGDEDLD